MPHVTATAAAEDVALLCFRRSSDAGVMHAADARHGAGRVWSPDAVVRHQRKADRRLLQHCEPPCSLLAHTCAQCHSVSHIMKLSG